jgi:hypothetical protein
MDHIMNQVDIVYILTQNAFKIRFNIIHHAFIVFFSVNSLIFNISKLFGNFFNRTCIKYINLYFIVLLLVYLKPIIWYCRPVRKIAKSDY